MNNELKQQLLKLTIEEIIELITAKPKQKASPWARFTIGKLDASIYTITNAGHQIVEFSVDIPEGTLCHIKKIEDVESCLKEINAIIAKYQK